MGRFVLQRAWSQPRPLSFWGFRRVEGSGMSWKRFFLNHSVFFSCFLNRRPPFVPFQDNSVSRCSHLPNFRILSVLLSPISPDTR
jgi:hypothetical protein